jgi:hypothetical protein
MGYRVCDHCSHFYVEGDPEDPNATTCRYCARPLRSCTIDEIRAWFTGRSLEGTVRTPEAEPQRVPRQPS